MAALLLLLLPLFTFGCEDKVVMPQQQPPPKSQGTGNTTAATDAATAPGMLPPVRSATDETEPVPEADASSIWAHLSIANPSRLFALLALTGLLDTDDLERFFADQVGLDALNAVVWDQQAHLFWLAESLTPVVVLTIKSKDEFITPLPENRIYRRQGNEISLPLSVAKTVYINFSHASAIISSDWRHFPLLQPHIDAILESPRDALVQGHFKLRNISLGEEINRLPPPTPALAAGWNASRDTLDDFCDTITSIDLTITEDDQATHLLVRTHPGERGPLKALLSHARPADPLQLYSRVTSLSPKWWLWHDLRQPPLRLDGLTIALISELLHRTEKADKTLLAHELDRAQALTGPVIRAYVERGEQSATIAHATIAQRDAFAAATAARRQEALEKGLATDPSLRPFAKRNAPDAFDALAFTKPKPAVAIEAIYGDDLTVVTAATSAEASRLVTQIAATLPEPPQLPQAMADVPGKKLLLFAYDGVQDRTTPPATLSLTLGDASLELHLHLPKAQEQALR